MNRIKAIFTALLILSAMCATAAADIPATFDWRDVNGTNYVTPVTDQGTCGSCWVHAAIGVIEAKIMIEHGVEIDLSEHYYVSDCWLYGDCSGGLGQDVFTFARYYGVPTEERCPTSSNYSCNICSNWETDAWFIDYQGSVFTSNTDIVKATIIEYGPVYTLINGGSHSIMIVGWDDTTGNWTCKNSHGPNKPNEGYIYVDYNSIDPYVRYVVGTHKHWNEWDDDCYIADAELSLACWHWCTNTQINGHLITDAEMSLLVYQWQTGDVC